MRVKLCARCPYTPRDLTGHYDPEAALHVCARCDGEQGVLTKHSHARPTGDENVQKSPTPSAWRGEAVRHL
jgi:hypothetical protein